jgi:hypothetical protein
MTNKTNIALSKLIKGQSVKTLHAPDCGSAPFFIVLIIACLVWVPVSAAKDDGTNKLSAGPQLQGLTKLGLTKVGEGRMKWFGFSIYRASLWTQNGVYLGIPVQQQPEQGLVKQPHLINGADNYPYSLPIALHIVYEKNISRETLIDTTIKEWRRLKIVDESQRQHWVQQLLRIWPDVKPGDSITTVMDNNHHTIFLVNGSEAGRVTDVRFGPALLAIWLHSETRATDLRTNLIGLQGG